MAASVRAMAEASAPERRTMPIPPAPGAVATAATKSAPLAGQIRGGTLEASNVEPVQELIDLITTQRAFELNSQIVQAGDQILQLVSNLRR